MDNNDVEIKRVLMGLTLGAFVGAAMILAIVRKLIRSPKKGPRSLMISDVELARTLRKDRYRQD